MKYPFSLKVLLVAIILIWGTGFILCKKSGESKLYFREDWKEIPAEIPVTQMHVSNPELILERHGTSADSIKKSHHDPIENDPWYIWSGLCKDPWAVTLHKKSSFVNLSSGARVQWRTKQFGNRVLKVVLGLEDGTWLVSEQGTGKSTDWEVFTLTLDDMQWRSLDIETVIAGDRVTNPNLDKVKYIGFTDLMPGGGSDECSRLDWIEVYGK